MPVGNDVVDLRDPANQPAAIHSRFDQRVFCDDELRLLDGLDMTARHRLRWTLWAARESAYKCIAQREPEAPFRPGEMTVRLAGPVPGRPAGRVEWDGREIEVRADCSADRVHVVTTGDADHGPVCALRRIAGEANRGEDAPGSSPDPHAVSAAARVIAARTVARVLDLPAPDVRIVLPSRATGRAGPRALRRGESLPVEFSISHDGDWIACAVAH